MLDAAWSTLDGHDCIRIAGGDARDPVVRVAGAPAGFPAVAGAFEQDGHGLCFVPRFPFADGTAYVVVDADGRESAPVRRVGPPSSPSATVVRILPTASAVPRNLLRIAVEFSAPMSTDGVAASIRLLGDDGRELTGALLPTQYELWDGAHTRLTVLLDPGRIKQGLARHEQDGYPLPEHGSFRVAVDATMHDARGAPLVRGSERSYRVVGPWTERLDPAAWRLRAPAAGSADPLDVDLDRSLDHALLQRCLRVLGPDGLPIAGRAEVGPEERSWRFIPDEPWRAEPHRLEVDDALEDLAGNTPTRPFDRDLTRSALAPSPADDLRFTPS